MAAYLIQTPASTLLMDCGPTALYALKQHGPPSDTIDAVLLSHFHGDHFAGLPFLFLEYVFERPRRRPLVIAGPTGTQERVEAIYRTMYKDLAAKPLPFPVEYLDLTPDRVVSVAGATILPFWVPHQEREVSLGFRLQIGTRTMLYSGDSGWTEAFVHHSQGTDLFICECMYFETRVDFHIDYPRLAENRARLGCKRLILTHIGSQVLARLPEVTEEVAWDGLTIVV